MSHEVADVSRTQKCLRSDGPHAPATVRGSLSLWSTLHRYRGLAAPASPPLIKALRLATRAANRATAGGEADEEEGLVASVDERLGGAGIAAIVGDGIADQDVADMQRGDSAAPQVARRRSSTSRVTALALLRRRGRDWDE